MSVKPSGISWSSYSQYEGPFFRGSQYYVAPSVLAWPDKVLSVMTATESGGAYDAYNGYDRMIVTVGLIQWGEAGIYAVSDMLGEVAKKDLAWLMSCLKPALDASGADFKVNPRGKWRFVFKDARGEVDTLAKQRQLFLLNSTGVKGTWDDASKAHAKLWASCLINVWASPVAQKAQVDYTSSRLMGFCTKSAADKLFSQDLPNEGWVGAVRAGYLSFAANLPAVASKHLDAALAVTKAEPWSKTWCIEILKSLTFGPKIVIYPVRYNAIRPVLERHFGVDLPDFAPELEQWRSEVLTPANVAFAFDKVEDFQKTLILLGYDLGPAGADGVMGSKTKLAICQFQAKNGLKPDGILGPKSREAFIRAATKLNLRA